MRSTNRDQAIRERAYAIWEQEGRPDGRSLAHWLKAKAEIETASDNAAPTLARVKRIQLVDRRQPQLLMPVGGGKGKKKDAAAAKPAPVAAPPARRKKANE
jgi:hypothetical protein